jgi:HSP20 family protein
MNDTSEERTTRAGGTPPSRWSPRELAEQLWDAGPARWDVWPFTEGALRLQDVGRPLGAPIRMEEVRDGDDLVVRAELPGVDPEHDVEVTVHEGVLSIRAERRETSDEKTAESYRSEFRYGRFERQIRLPEGTSPDVVSATYKDGVLEVRLPLPTGPSAGHRVDVKRA